MEYPDEWKQNVPWRTGDPHSNYRLGRKTGGTVAVNGFLNPVPIAPGKRTMCIRPIWFHQGQLVALTNASDCARIPFLIDDITKSLNDSGYIIAWLNTGIDDELGSFVNFILTNKVRSILVIGRLFLETGRKMPGMVQLSRMHDKKMQKSPEFKDINDLIRNLQHINARAIKDDQRNLAIEPGDFKSLAKFSINDIHWTDDGNLKCHISTPPDFSHLYSLACAYALDEPSAANKTRALECLSILIAASPQSIESIKGNPFFDSIKNEAAFLDIIQGRRGPISSPSISLCVGLGGSKAKFEDARDAFAASLKKQTGLPEAAQQESPTLPGMVFTPEEAKAFVLKFKRVLLGKRKKMEAFKVADEIGLPEPNSLYDFIKELKRGDLVRFSEGMITISDRLNERDLKFLLDRFSTYLQMGIA